MKLVIFTVAINARRRYIIIKIIIILRGKLMYFDMDVVNSKVLLIGRVSFLILLVFGFTFNINTVGIVNIGMINTFLSNLNFSFEAILVIYMNRISIPPTIIRNRMYENQKFWLKFPVIKLTKMVCKRRIKPIDNGCLINKNVSEAIVLRVIRIIISGNSLS